MVFWLFVWYFFGVFLISQISGEKSPASCVREARGGHLGARLWPRLGSPGGSPGRGGRRSVTGGTAAAPAGAGAGAGSPCPTAAYRLLCSPAASGRKGNAHTRAGTKFCRNL